LDNLAADVKHEFNSDNKRMYDKKGILKKVIVKVEGIYTNLKCQALQICLFIKGYPIISSLRIN
jgi:hypothetical protein